MRAALFEHKFNQAANDIGRETRLKFLVVYTFWQESYPFVFCFFSLDFAEEFQQVQRQLEIDLFLSF